MKTIIKMSAVLLLLFAFWGCTPGGVIVTAQPAAPVYVRPAAPYPGYVWIDGEWYWSGGRYVYRQGYWAPPRAHRVWVGGSWERRGNGYYWRKGHWR